MRFLWLFLLASLVVLTVAKRKDSSSDSDSKSHSHESREYKKCRHCRDLAVMKTNSRFPAKRPRISYFHDEDGCRRATISCPFDGHKYFFVTNNIKDILLASGTHMQRVVKCNNNGSFETEMGKENKMVDISEVTCEINDWF